jgi:hypothetical protein
MRSRVVEVVVRLACSGCGGRSRVGSVAVRARLAHQQKVTNLTRPYQTMSAPPDPLRSASLVSALRDHVLDL